MPKKFSVDQIAYWGTFLFSAAIIGYLLVTLIDTATKEDTSMSQNIYVKRQVHFATIDTSFGSIRILLARTAVPVSTNNFVALAQAGFYDKTKFHRVVKGLLVQGGDPLSRQSDRDLYGTGGPGYVYPDEISDEKMMRGVVALAHLGKPNTNGSQFFIIVADTAPLMDGKYTVIGKVIDGMDVVDKISNVPVDEKQIPVDPVYVDAISTE